MIFTRDTESDGYIESELQKAAEINPFLTGENLVLEVHGNDLSAYTPAVVQHIEAMMASHSALVDSAQKAEITWVGDQCGQQNLLPGVDDGQPKALPGTAAGEL
jgi:hypothetical protein